MDKTFITALTGEGKPYNRACSAREMHPFCRLQRRLSTGKRLTRFSVAYGSLRIVFACHPGGGDLLSAYPCANLSCSLYSGEKTSPSGGSPRRGIGVHFCCGDPAEGLQVGRSLSLACTQKDLPMNRPTDEARFYGFRCQRQRCRQRRHIYSSPKAIPQPFEPARWKRAEPSEPSEPSEPCHAVAPWAIPHPLNLLNPLKPLTPLYFPIVI